MTADQPIVQRRLGLAAEVTASRQARRVVVAAASEVGRHQLDDFLLVVSELVTNAVEHGAEPIELLVRIDGAMHVAVTDASPEPPILRGDEPDSTRGRGVRIVDTLAQAWGVEPTPPGKKVWATLA